MPDAAWKNHQGKITVAQPNSFGVWDIWFAETGRWQARSCRAASAMSQGTGECNLGAVTDFEAQEE